MEGERRWEWKGRCRQARLRGPNRHPTERIIHAHTTASEKKSFPTTHLTRDGRPGRPHWICSPGACRNRSLACPAPRDKVAICWSGYRSGARLQLRNGSVPARRRVGGPEQGPKPTLSIRRKPRDQHGPIWTLNPNPWCQAASRTAYQQGLNVACQGPAVLDRTHEWAVRHSHVLTQIQAGRGNSGGAHTPSQGVEEGGWGGHQSRR